MEFIIPPELKKLRPQPYLNDRATETLSRLRSPTGIIIEQSVKRRLMDQGFVFDDERDNKSQYDPNQMFEQLAKYVNKDVEPKFDGEAWSKAYNLTRKAFSIKNKLQPLRTDAERVLAMKGEKSSGAPYFGKKADSTVQDLRIMHRWLDGKRGAEPCVAQHRVQHGENGPKNRLVWAYPQHVTLAEASFARPLIDYYVDKNCPMAFGKHRFKIAAKMVAMMNQHAMYGLDMRGFDSSVCRQLINMAFEIIKKQFDMLPEDEIIFERVKHYFIHTPILMPDGMKYTKHRGVPSGSYFTQMVDSIVNFFVVQYTWFQLTGENVYPDRIMVLGDDSLFTSPHLISIKKFNELSLRIGFEIHVDDKSFVAVDGNLPPHFLGHEWIKGLVDRPEQDVAKRMVYPERHQMHIEVKQRIDNRVFQYVTDSLSAHNIIVRMARAHTNDIHAYYDAEVQWSNVELGWKEHQRTTLKDTWEDDNTYRQAIVGIQK